MLPFRNTTVARRLSALSLLDHQRRRYAVKVLPWCAKGGGQTMVRRDRKEPQDDQTATRSWQPIPRFGVIAAMSLNRVIGVDGSLPWEYLEQDRKMFTDLTANQLVIMGRTTFHETADYSHIRHVGCCVVVSTTMTSKSDKVDHQWNGDDDFPDMRFAGSFLEALDIARTVCDGSKPTTPSTPATNSHAEVGNQSSSMTCWVVGGERLYNEAVMHPSLDTIHLSIVDRTIDEHPGQLIRRFPPQYRWDHKFVLGSKETFDGFEYHKYFRNRGFV